MTGPAKPSGFEDDLGPFGAVMYDGWCGLPIAWGFPILRYLGDDRFNQLRCAATVDCVDMGKWVVVTRYLSLEDAIREYGPITHVLRGPLGGFKRVTFGSKTFLQKTLDPGEGPGIPTEREVPTPRKLKPRKQNPGDKCAYCQHTRRQHPRGHGPCRACEKANAGSQPCSKFKLPPR